MITLLIVAMTAATDVEPPQFWAGNEELRGYLLEAANNNPALLARYEEWRAKLERIPQVTSLDDPMLSYGQFLESETQRARFAISQKFPWFGTLRARGNKAAAEADAALQAFFSERNRVFAEVKTAYFEYAFLGKAIRVAEAQVEVLKYMEDVVTSKLALAMAKQDELLRVSIEKSKVQDRIDGFLERKPALMAQLNETMGREVLEDIPWPQSTEFPPALPPADAVLAQVEKANPDLRAFDHFIERRQQDIELAKKAGYPDFTLGLEYVSISKPRTMRPDRPYPASLNAGYRVLNTVTGNVPFDPVNAAIDAYALGTSREPMSYPDSLDDNVMLSLTISVPIWRKRIKAAIEEARLMQRATEYEKRRKELALKRAARMTVFEVEDARRRHALYRDTLVPQAEQTYESLQSQYSAAEGDTDFLDLLDSVQTLLAFQLEEVRAARDVQVAAAQLEYLTGGPWDASRDSAAHENDNPMRDETQVHITTKRNNWGPQ
ncbi:MAG: TolC family protein [Candidatus Hydrogenedentota bacterium]